MPEDNRLEADSTQRVSQSLAELPDAPATPSKREIVARLASDIQSARNKGYTLKTIARHLQDRARTNRDGTRTDCDGLMTDCDGP